VSPTAPARHAEPPPFFRTHRFESLASTSDEAKRMAAAGAPEGTLVLACRQTGGRGRRGRHWDSPEGNFHGSLLLRPACPVPVAAQLSFVAAVAVAQALTAWLAAERIRLKWPNDVLADGAKLAGILAESASAADARVAWLVLGIGVNLTHCPQGLDYAATSLSALGQAGVSPEAMLGTLAPALLDWYRRWQRHGFAPVREAWLSLAVGLRQPVRALTPDGIVEGVFRDLDPAGALLLAMPDGGQRRIEAGEVEF
jgi:BirA family transcriptional regulator, biotin operon repressor / biotin---[acetyl-CoA-carboxylase] ligase